MNLLLNGLPVLTFRMLLPWTGAWVADFDLDGDVPPPTSGPALVAGDATLVGTVDPLRSGKFGERPRVGIVAGGGGWSKTVRAQHYHSDGALPFATVLAATAAEVLETATLLEPVMLAEDFVRVAGPASQVLSGRAWWVGLDGVTRVGQRPPVAPPEGLEVLDWDQATGVATAACDGLVEPGTMLADERFGGAKVVRDAELELSAEGLRARLWLVDEVVTTPSPSPFVQAVRALAVDAIRPETMRRYRYRVIGMAGERVVLQAIDAGAPDLQPVRIWAGVPGAKAELAPGAEVLVGFRAGDAPTPIVEAFAPTDGAGWAPLTLDFEANAAISIKAPQVNLADASDAAVLLSAFIAWGKTVATAINGLVPGAVQLPTALMGSTKVRLS